MSANLYEFTVDAQHFGTNKIFINVESINIMAPQADGKTVKVLIDGTGAITLDHRELESALNASGSRILKMAMPEDVQLADLDTDDIEDVSDLSNGKLVDEAGLSQNPNINNAHVEGSVAVEESEAEVKYSREEVAQIISDVISNLNK